jgi:hypothetical protein
VPIWIEGFALAVLATVFVGVVVLNVLNWIQRTGLGIGIVGFSIFLAQSLYLFNESKKNSEWGIGRREHHNTTRRWGRYNTASGGRKIKT